MAPAHRHRWPGRSGGPRRRLLGGHVARRAEKIARGGQTAFELGFPLTIGPFATPKSAIFGTDFSTLSATAIVSAWFG